MEYLPLPTKLFPKTPTDNHLQIRILLLKSNDSCVETNFSILCFIVTLERAQFSFLQPTESEDQVSTEISWNIFWQEFSDFNTVLGPVGVVADDFVVNVFFAIGGNFNIGGGS
jgi:hypothetical protein